MSVKTTDPVIQIIDRYENDIRLFVGNENSPIAQQDHDGDCGDKVFHRKTPNGRQQSKTISELTSGLNQLQLSANAHFLILS
jgi:hypothetical protein